MGEFRRFALLVFVIIGPLLIAGASGGRAAQAETEEVVAAVARDFYPEYATEADGRPGGFAIDMMNAVAKRAGLSITFRVFETWADLIAALERGDADVVPAVSVTPAREERMLFTRPVVTSTSSLFVRQDTGDIRGLDDLAGRRVGVIRGGVSAEILSERETRARIVPYARLQDMLFALMSGEIDALVSFESSMWKVSERARLADWIKVVGGPMTGVKRAIAVRQDLPALRDRLDAAVADFLGSAAYRELSSRWYAAPPPFWNPVRTTWLAGASVALLLLGMLVWQTRSMAAQDRAFDESVGGQGMLGRPLAVDARIGAVIARGCGLAALALGLAVLLGWAFDVGALKNVLRGLVAMQPWTATAIALAGGALLAATASGRTAVAVSLALAGMVLIIGLQTLLQYATGLDLSADRWLFSSAVTNQTGIPHPGRLAEATSVAFTLLGTMLLLARVRRAWARRVVSIIGAVGLLFMAAPLLGYLIGAGSLQSVALFTPVAVHAALGLVVLFLGALAMRPGAGWIAALFGNTPGATTARMLLPIVVIGPVLLTILFEAGRKAGAYGPEFRLALTTLATIALLAAGVLWSAVRVDRLHRARLAAVEALRDREARYRTAGEAIRYGVWVCNPAGGVEFVSQTFLNLIGKTLDEVKPRGWLDRLPPEDIKPALHAWHQCVRAGSEWTWEHRVKGRDGVWRTILSLGRPVRDDRDRITSWVGFNLDISERKQAEDALRESEARFRGTFENAAVGIANVGTDGAWLRVNQRLCDILGYSRGELLQKTLQELTHPKDLPITLDRFTALIRGEIDTYHLEKRYLHKDGHAVWVDLTSAVQRDHDGNPAYCIAIIEDIGARKRAEEAVRESEIRMRALLDASQDEILLVSTQGEVLAINRTAERRLAKRTGGSNPVGAHLDGLLPQDQVEQRMALVRQVAATATLVHWEAQIRSRWFEFWFYPALRPDEPVSEVAIYAREITEQKRSQADLSKLFQAIQQSPMSVVITDRNGTVEYVNPEFTKVTGYTLAETVGQNSRILKSGHTPPEQYAELWNTICAGDVWRGELLNRKKSGELFWELASIAPVKDGDRITNFVAVKEDITERREVEEQLRQSQKMQAVGQLTGGIAHDFNNLLAIVIGNLQLLEERVGDDAKTREYLHDALWSAKRGGELTHRLLAFARKQPLKPVVIDLNEVVRGTTDLLRRTLGGNVCIKESLAADLWKTFADRGELENALVNLAVNSRDAMRSAGTLTLETRNAVLDADYARQYEEVTPGEYVLLAVADTGAGMSSEIVQRVFEPFFTTKEVGQGSGLGLSMVYGFVKQTGGHVSIYSRVGQGTCVKLYLPRAASSPAGREETSPDVFLADLGTKIVLVVEDEARLRRVAVKMLDRLGLQSLQAASAKDALELLASTHADVLFTDIELPGGINGIELADAAHRLYPKLKVLFTTGYARETTLHGRGSHESAPWLLKPYSHQDLARGLKAVLAPAVH
ncbi:MAG: PAS domain S-box protein [Rhodospirillales bacterium]|nr:PAS domain S-box protein [Rhodospirillales bacterium]